jgi:hypothetical protein
MGPITCAGFISSLAEKDLPDGRREPCPRAQSSSPMLDSGEMADARAGLLKPEATAARFFGERAARREFCLTLTE